jgi:hypothetical protein
MSTLPGFKTIRCSRLFISLLFLLICAVPVRLHAQALGPPGVSVNEPFWEGYSYYFTGGEYPSGNADAYAWFEWGTTAAYGSASSHTHLPYNGQPASFNASVNGLVPNTLYHYRAAASNYLATGYSPDAIFTTAGPPVITSEPQSQAVAPGSTVTFTVGAYSGLSLSYQWEKDGVSIAAATASAFTITNAQSSDAGTYMVMVSNVYFGGWVIASSSVSLNVGSAPTPLLQASHAQGNLVLAWPVYQPGYNLEISTNLNSTNWTSAAVTLLTNGNTITATIPAASGQRFYRLRYP